MSRYLKKTSIPITLVVLLVAAIFAFRGEAQQPKNSKSASGATAKVDRPIWGTAVAFAESDEVRDLPDAKTVRNIADGDAGEGEYIGREINEQNSQVIKTPN